MAPNLQIEDQSKNYTRCGITHMVALKPCLKNVVFVLYKKAIINYPKCYWLKF